MGPCVLSSSSAMVDISMLGPRIKYTMKIHSIDVCLNGHELEQFQNVCRTRTTDVQTDTDGQSDRQTELKLNF